MSMKRFQRLPLSLFRIQAGPTVSLRDYDTQMAKNRLSYDLKLHGNLVLPMQGDVFHTPNGMSLRPASDKMVGILESFRGVDVRVYRLQEHSLLPDGLVVLHEHSDHYSLQVSKPMNLKDFNARLTDYLASVPSQTKEEFMEWFNDPNDQDN